MTDKMFEIKDKKYIAITNKSAYFCNKSNNVRLSKEDVKKSIEWLINNSYFKFGNTIFRQKIGIPMGTDAAPFIANLHLHQYEYDFISKSNNVIKNKFRHVFRYIDDITVVNDDGYFKEHYKLIYPNSLKLEQVNEYDNKANVLDLNITIKDGKIDTTIYDKRDDYNFDIINFAHADSNMSKTVFTGIIFSQISRYFNICNDISYFYDNLYKLYNKLLGRNYSIRFLKSKFNNTCRKLFNNHNKYNIDYSTFKDEYLKIIFMKQ